MKIKHHYNMQDLLQDNLGERVSLMLTSGVQVNGILAEFSDNGFVLLQKVSSGFECREPDDMCNDAVIPTNTILGVTFYTGRLRRGTTSKEWVDENGGRHSSSKDITRWVDVEYKDGKFVDATTPPDENVNWYE